MQDVFVYYGKDDSLRKQVEEHGQKINRRYLEVLGPERYERLGGIVSRVMNPPPAEKKDNVIQFELTTGCSYNRCGFCTMYRGQKFGVKSFKQYCNHVDRVWNDLKKIDPQRKIVSGLERVFIGGGNVLGVESDLLQAAITYTITSFKKNVGKIPRRIATYGNTRDILKHKSQDLVSAEGGPHYFWPDLKFLNCGGVCGRCSKNKFGSRSGLDLIYWGVESGDSQVLDYARKGYTQEDIFEASRVVDYSKVDISAMIIVGLGGERFYSDHVQGSARVLNFMRPKFITFMGINASAESDYHKKMQEEIRQGKNRPLNNHELTLQMAEIIKELHIEETTLGCHDETVHRFGFNPYPFGSVEITGYRDREKLFLELVRGAEELKNGPKGRLSWLKNGFFG